MPVNEFAYNLNTVKYTDNDLSSLKTVKIYDKDGNLKETVTAELLTEEEASGRTKTYGDRQCRSCGIMFTANNRYQKSCEPCIKKRPVSQLSMRRRIPALEKLKGGHPNANTEIQKRIQIPDSI